MDYYLGFFEAEAIHFWFDCLALEIGLFNWCDRVVCRAQQYLLNKHFSSPSILSWIGWAVKS